MADDFGDRMKMYEAQATSARLDVHLPICARIDGRSFSTFTRGCDKPFDSRISSAMRQTCKYLVDESHAKIGYVQSDEITLVWQAQEGGSVFFDGKVQKMTSVLASLASVRFYAAYGGQRLPSFDCRVWQLPNRTEAANAVLWRVLDARKNAVSSACRSQYSAKAMHGKGREEQLEMLAEKGIEFESAYAPEDKWGAFYRRVFGKVEMDDETWNKIPVKHRPESRLVVRSWVEQIPMPFFGDVANREDVIFNGDAPLP